MQKIQNNFAFIDSQNLNMGIKSLGWALDFKKFRVYLKEKYSVSTAYLFIDFSPHINTCSSLLKKAREKIVFIDNLKNKLEYKKKNTA